jgi:putative ABC transport system permease protein
MTRLLLWPLGVLRLIVQSAGLALGQIWANKVRSMLTMLGIIIAVASVSAVIAALTGLKTTVLAEFETVGAKKIFIFPYMPDTGRQKHAAWESIQLQPEQFDGLEAQCPSVEAITRFCSYQATVRAGDKSLEGVTITGIDPAWYSIVNRSILQGRTFSHVDAERGANICLIDDTLQEKLQLAKDCVGQTLLVRDRSFIIVGLLDKRQSGSLIGNMGPNYEIFVPFNTAYRANRNMHLVMAGAKSAEVSEDARSEIRYFLRKSRHLAFSEPDNFHIEAVEEYLRKFNEIAAIVTLVAAGIVGISLLVGGVGIMNIMLVSVSERTREIGLRKSVGARPSAILLQFLVEAVMLCLVGGLIGLLIGQAMVSLVSLIPQVKEAHLDQSYIPLWAVVLAFGFSALVGIVFGTFPAIKAARLDPIDALRHE